MIDYEILQDIITDHELCNVQKNELTKVVELLKSDRLIELPCKVGDTVWTVQLTSETPWIAGTEYYDIFEDEFELYLLDALGEWTFLTKEEAEAKLNALKGKTNETE